MPNTESPSDRNFSIFSNWSASKTDTDFSQLVGRGVLSRTEIARECQFAKSVLDQNPRVKAALRKLEDGLRERGVLPPLAVQDTQQIETELVLTHRQSRKAGENSDRERQLEIENASLKAELDELKQRLSKYENLHTALVLTGRVPR
ncbi:VPA1267 family protein [Paraburkholderia strydomiana]|uniref:VPA1267 family protein n=1 Tax=Paraburkholderia strydomiana TaxID=1245417 RepID=UPI0038BBD63F